MTVETLQRDPQRGAASVAASPRWGRLARRWSQSLLYAILTLLLISSVTFVAGNYRSAEDVARSALSREATVEQIDAYIAEHRLDAPLVVRYGEWLSGFVQGDWGVSASNGRPVADDVMPRFKNTVILALGALVVGTPVAVLYGLVMARSRRRGSRTAMSIISVVLASLPEFVIGAVLLLVFSVQLKLLPVISTAAGGGAFIDQALAYVLPILTLVVALLPHVARMTDASVREALQAPYVKSALIRGITPSRVLRGYGLRNASVPIINAVGLNTVYLLSGVIVVESVFAFPGIGELLVQAINAGDAMTIQAVAVLMAAFFIVTGMLVDAIAVYFNPRLRARA